MMAQILGLANTLMNVMLIPTTHPATTNKRHFNGGAEHERQVGPVLGGMLVDFFIVRAGLKQSPIQSEFWKTRSKHGKCDRNVFLLLLGEPGSRQVPHSCTQKLHSMKLHRQCYQAIFLHAGSRHLLRTRVPQQEHFCTARCAVLKLLPKSATCAT